MTPSEAALHNQVVAVCRPAKTFDPELDVVYAQAVATMVKNVHREALERAVRVLLAKGIATNEVVEAIRGLQ